jgi:hypothetical protein
MVIFINKYVVGGDGRHIYYIFIKKKWAKRQRKCGRLDFGKDC